MAAALAVVAHTAAHAARFGDLSPAARKILSYVDTWWPDATAPIVDILRHLSRVLPTREVEAGIAELVHHGYAKRVSEVAA